MIREARSRVTSACLPFASGYLQPFFAHVILEELLTQWLGFLFVSTPHPVLPPFDPR